MRIAKEHRAMPFSSSGQLLDILCCSFQSCLAGTEDVNSKLTVIPQLERWISDQKFADFRFEKTFYAHFLIPIRTKRTIRGYNGSI